MSNFSTLPRVLISRSKFVRKSQHKTSFDLGRIIPIYIDDVLPGDTRKIDLGALVRMSTPIAPIMDNIYIDLYAFFVPHRLTWQHWKEFMGENSSGAGIYSGTAYKIPMADLCAYGLSSGSIGDHMGLPITGADASKHIYVSCLPIRGYKLIYNRFFRDQNVTAPQVVNTGDTVNYSYDSYTGGCFFASKFSDYFTRALPYAQKGAPVSIPLGTTADVYLHNPIGGSALNIDSPLLLGENMAADAKSYHIGVQEGSAPYDQVFLKADLTHATAATINQLRFAFQYQKLLEKDSLYGTRYWEILKAHFGVVAPDASLQDPELLGHRRFAINVDQVIQTTGINQATPSQNELGATAAVSVTGFSGNLFTKSFTEHGFLHIYAVARHDQTYGQGVDRMWSRSLREDFYFPVFANLGAQKVLNKEIYADGSSNDAGVFGYQEAWAEYRYKPSKVTGLLNPSVSGSLGYWTLANNFSQLPTLSKSFIDQDRSNLARALSTGATGPDFIADFAFRDIAVRPMPMYSIPGLIDHH